MIPTVELRLASMMRTVRDVILPALAQDGFATEQAKLMMGHLHILLTHVDVVPEFEALEQKAAMRLASDMLARCKGGTQTQAAAAGLARQLEAARAVPAHDRPAIRASRSDIHAGIETLLAAVSTDGDAAFKAEAPRQVIAAERTMADRSRVMFAHSGFEGAVEELPSLEAMMAAFRAELA